MSHLLSGSRGCYHCLYHTVGGAFFCETIGKSPIAALALIKVAYTERTMKKLVAVSRIVSQNLHNYTRNRESKIQRNDVSATDSDR